MDGGFAGKYLLTVAVACTLPEQYSEVAKYKQRQALRSSRRYYPFNPQPYEQYQNTTQKILLDGGVAKNRKRVWRLRFCCLWGIAVDGKSF
jgi:hypothetical protein